MAHGTAKDQLALASIQLGTLLNMLRTESVSRLM